MCAPFGRLLQAPVARYLDDGEFEFSPRMCFWTRLDNSGVELAFRSHRNAVGPPSEIFSDLTDGATVPYRRTGVTPCGTIGIVLGAQIAG